MADIALPRRLTFDLPLARVIELVVARREVLVLAAIMSFALVLRLWDLDAKALHHDESLHATFSYYLYEGRGYHHDPLMHGPFQFHVNALSFFLFGATDFTARLPHALFGTAIVGMPFLLRKQLGTRAVLFAAVLLAISPTMLYFSRFDREDVYSAFWTIAIVVCALRYLDEKKEVWLYGMAASLAGGFATKELTFIFVAVLLVFLDLMLAFELAKGDGSEKRAPLEVLVRAMIVAPFAWALAALWPFVPRRHFGVDKLPAAGDLMVVLGTLTLPQLAAAIQLVVGDDGYNAPSEDKLRMITVPALIAASAYIGLLWRPRAWLIVALCFYGPFFVLFTTFFTHLDGFWSGIWGSLDYWLKQQEERRGNQPMGYYTLLVPLYEFLPLLLALGGAAWLSLRGQAIGRWLLFWAGGMFIGLTIAGEKMPWLGMHLAMPLCLIGGVVLARATEGFGADARRWLVAAAAAALASVAVLLLVEGDGALRTTGILLAAAIAGGTLASAFGGRQAIARTALAVFVGAMLTLTVRTSINVAFKNDDTPVEMLVYVQTSPEIPALMDRIDALAAQSGLGKNLPIVVDNTSGFAWPWAWYLRDYHEVSYLNTGAQNYRPPENAVLLLSTGSLPNISTVGYTEQRYRHRWWFNETYRGTTLGDAIGKLTHWDSLESLGHFFLYRRPVGVQTPSEDAIALFPESLTAHETEAALSKPPLAPRRQADGRIVIGTPGRGRGELDQPADVSIDPQGNIWVADARNNRVQKFDSVGNFLGVVGRFGNEPGSFSEPWSVAVDNDGFVYVTDTWNHRIEKFSPTLELVDTWGGPAQGPSPSPLQFYGPRDIVVAPDGTLWITDTGNKRLVNLTRDGDPIGTFGSEGMAMGQFSEPVGLTIDAAGRFFVADAWNGRVQRFDPGFTAPYAFATGWQSREIYAKPYVAALTDGRIVVSDPARGVLILLSAQGAPIGTWRPETNSRPVGIAATSDGGFVFSDAGRSEVQVVPPALIASLFK